MQVNPYAHCKNFYVELFQVRVRIIEGRQLSGSNISPVVRVTVANHTRQTKVKHSTNKPFYDEVSCTNRVTYIVLLYKCLSFTCEQMEIFERCLTPISVRTLCVACIYQNSFISYFFVKIFHLFGLLWFSLLVTKGNYVSVLRFFLRKTLTREVL